MTNNPTPSTDGHDLGHAKQNWVCDLQDVKTGKSYLNVPTSELCQMRWFQDDLPAPNPDIIQKVINHKVQVEHLEMKKKKLENAERALAEQSKKIRQQKELLKREESELLTPVQERHTDSHSRGPSPVNTFETDVQTQEIVGTSSTVSQEPIVPKAVGSQVSLLKSKSVPKLVAPVNAKAGESQVPLPTPKSKPKSVAPVNAKAGGPKSVAPVNAKAGGSQVPLPASKSKLKSKSKSKSKSETREIIDLKQKIARLEKMMQNQTPEPPNELENSLKRKAVTQTTESLHHDGISTLYYAGLRGSLSPMIASVVKENENSVPRESLNRVTLCFVVCAIISRLSKKTRKTSRKAEKKYKARAPWRIARDAPKGIARVLSFPRRGR